MNRNAVVLQSTDPFENLAVEETLFDSLPSDSELLVLYVNSPCVVIGKHQNPWLEVNLRELARRRIPLVRRISGGGTVYHDEGNINFSFIGPRGGFDRKKNLVFIHDVLERIGVDTELTENHDLFIDGRKISGNAFCFRKDRALHHGTLLVNADLASLDGLLSPPPLPIETHAVRSKPSPTMNLSDLKGDVSCPWLIRRVAEEFSKGPYCPALGPEVIEQHASTGRSWEWVYGRTPEFSLKLLLSESEAHVRIKHGCISGIEGRESIGAATAILEGLPFCRADLETVILESTVEGDALELLETLVSMTV